LTKRIPSAGLTVGSNSFDQQRFIATVILIHAIGRMNSTLQWQLTQYSLRPQVSWWPCKTVYRRQLMWN